MEFNEKLQELRKAKGLTQEALAEKLYVSRTAISKWESGRGYPSIESLKEIALFFSVTVDELLSSGEILSIATEEQKQIKKHFCDIAFGLLDVCAVLLFFLPLFATRSDGLIQACSLLSPYGIQPWMKILFSSLSAITVILGIFTLAAQNLQIKFWANVTHVISLSLSAVSLLFLILCLQPYAAVFTFILAAVKVFFLIRQ